MPKRKPTPHPQANPLALPPYQVRVSSRARHVSIRVSPRREIEVVIPVGYDASKVPALLEKRRSWLARHIQRLESEERAIATQPPQDACPQEINLSAINETWTVSYRHTPDNHVLLEVKAQQHLQISGAIAETQLCQQVLRQWLQKKAYAHFAPWLRHVSQELELPYSRITVRHQKTRWASCSDRKSISLNLKLLFLPPPLVRYVFIHELCHTIHMNHSADFWTLVHQKDPHYKPTDTELRKGWRYVPPWADA